MINPILKLIANRNRKAWSKSDAQRDKNYTIPESVNVIKDLSYGPYGKWNLLDVNLPKNAAGKLPVIVNFHGGGFFYGTKEVYQFYCAYLADKGFAVVSFNYRLSPENHFPAHIEDCNKACTWICDNAEKYNFDLNRIYFTGDSAGGNLVYMYSTILTNPQYAALFNLTLPAARPKAVAMNCALYNMDLSGKDPLTKAYVPNIKKYTEHLSIHKYVTSSFPPAFIMSAANDFLLPQLQPQADFFESKGVEYCCKAYGEKSDSTAIHVFHINIGIPAAIQCNADEMAFFENHR